MKRIVKFVGILMLVALCFSIVSCGNETKEADLWESAVYTKDAEFGSGAKTLLIEVKADDKSITFTINTDKETVGEALATHDLISGEQGAYGIYIKQVNGITADYSKDQSYWSLTKDGQYMMTGVDSTKFNDGEHFELTYTK